MSKQIKITVTIVVAVIVAYVGYRYMRGLPFFRSSKIIYTHYKKVNGLNTGAAIYISGVKIGNVEDIDLLGTDSVKVALAISNNHVTITKGSVAKLASNGLLGNKAIYIIKGNRSQVIPNGGTIKGIYSEGMLSSLKESGTELANSATKTFKKLSSTIERLKKVVDKDNRRNIDQMLASLQTAASQLAKLMKNKRKQIEQVIAHANRLLANLDTLTTKNGHVITHTLSSLKQTMNNLQTITNKLKKSNNKLNSILSKINKGKGTLGKLVNDPSLYNHLDSLSVSLTRLINDLKKNPTKYLKGVHLIEVF